MRRKLLAGTREKKIINQYVDYSREKYLVVRYDTWLFSMNVWLDDSYQEVKDKGQLLATKIRSEYYDYWWACTNLHRWNEGNFFFGEVPNHWSGLKVRFCELSCVAEANKMWSCELYFCWCPWLDVFIPVCIGQSLGKKIGLEKIWLPYCCFNSLISPLLHLPTHKYKVEVLFVGRTLQQSLLGDCKRNSESVSNNIANLDFI